MLNCGFYAVDIGTLRQDEVDWKAGRIVRKRSKTKNRSGNVPKVNYPLWHRTFELLKVFRNTTPRHPELALVNEEGNPLWWEHQKDGKYVKNNTVKCLYFRLLSKTLKIPAAERKPLKTLRKTASSKLDEHETYGRYVEYFLGEAPSSVANRHYVQPSAKQFERAIGWLGKQFGIS